MAARPFFFKLQDRTPVPCSWYEANVLLSDFEGRCLAFTRTRNGFQVSTAFLVFDHNAFGERPVLWNTIITDPDGGQRLMGRYSSEEDARRGHAHACSFLELVGG